MQADLHNDQLQWDPSLLLENKTPTQWLDEAQVHKDWLIANHDVIFDSLENFQLFVNHTHQLNEILSRIYAYADALSALQQDDPVSNSIYAQVSLWAQDYYDVYYNDVNEIIAHQAIIQHYLDIDPSLGYLKRDYELIFKNQKHTLFKDQEKLVNELSKDNSSFGALYETIVDQDLKFATVYDSRHQPHVLTTSLEINQALQDSDRVLRKHAYYALKKGYESVCHTVCQCLYFHYLNANAWAKAYHYENYIQACCEQDEIEIDFVKHVYEMGHLFAPAHRLYNRYTKKLLKYRYGYPKIYGYDTYLAVTKANYYFGIDQAKQIVVNALSCFGQPYIEFIQKMLASRYIDWMPKENKSSGGYTQGLGFPTDYSLILLNYDYSYGSLATLIHELGHSAQNYFSKNKHPNQANMPIFCAEIASLTNEILLAYYLLDMFAHDQEMVLYIYKHLIYETFGATLDQIILSRFEWKANEMIETGQPFSVESVAQSYLETELEYQVLKPKVFKQKNYLYKYGLSTLFVSHFYSGNFYVYKYSIGQVCALLLAEKIFHHDQSTIEAYYNFLSAGNSLSPMDTIKLLGIDLNQVEPWKQAAEILNQWVLDYTSIVKKVVKTPKNPKKPEKNGN